MEGAFLTKPPESADSGVQFAFLEMADKLSARVGNPHAIGSAMLMAGITKSLADHRRQAAGAL